MIAYFANRALHILGIASTDLRNEEVALITDDSIVESLEAGSSSLDMTVNFNDNNRLQIQDMMEAGNYVLLNVDREKRYYTIIDTEIDTSNKTVSIYAEDAGLDLLNEVVGPSVATQEYPISHYINQCIYDTGFSIRYNEFDTDTKKVLSWDSQQTAAERLLEIAETFKAEIQYSFRINGLDIKRKYIDVYKKKGKEQSYQFRLGVDVDNMHVTRSVANLCTCLEVEGGQDVHGNTLTFNYPTQMEYDNGDIYISGSRLYSRKALERWSRYVYDEEPRQIANVGHIVGYFQYDTTNRTELRNKAIEYLKKVYDVEVNYDISINRLDENVELGDTISIVDDKDELYLTARVLEIQSSVTKRTRTCTLGNFKKKTSGINPKLQRLADNFERIASARSFYTWIAYADDDQGTGISLNPNGKTYIGVASNKTISTADISDPSVYTWSLYVGPEGESPVITTHYNETTKILEIISTLDGVGTKIGEVQDGNGVVSTVIKYGKSTNGYDYTTVPNWYDTIPSYSQGEYLWTWTHTTYLRSNPTDTYSVTYKPFDGAPGSPAKQIKDITRQYVLLPDGVEPDDNTSWYDDPPTYVNGQKYWRRDFITFTDLTTTTTSGSLDNSLNEAMDSYMKSIVRNEKQYTISSSDKEVKIYTYSEFAGNAFVEGTTYYEKINSLLSSDRNNEGVEPYVTTAYQVVSGAEEFGDFEDYSDDTTKVYAVGDRVEYEDEIYICIEATTGGGFDNTKWTIFEYSVGDLVIYGNKYYICIETTRAESFDKTKWQDKSNDYGRVYYIDDKVFVGDTVYRCYPSQIAEFSSNAGTIYSVGTKVIYDNKVYICVEATTGGTFDPSKWNETYAVESGTFDDKSWTVVAYYIYVETTDQTMDPTKTYYVVSNKADPSSEDWYKSLYDLLFNESKQFFENDYIWSRDEIEYGSGRIEHPAESYMVETISEMFSRTITFNSNIEDLNNAISLNVSSIAHIRSDLEGQIAEITNKAIFNIEPGAITGTISEYIDSMVDGVSDRLTETEAKLTTDGFIISQSDRETSSQVDAEGIKVIKQDPDDPNNTITVAQFTNDQSYVDYLHVDKYMAFGAHQAEAIELEEYDGTAIVGTGFFYIGVQDYGN